MALGLDCGSSFNGQEGTPLEPLRIDLKAGRENRFATDPGLTAAVLEKLEQTAENIMAKYKVSEADRLKRIRDLRQAVTEIIENAITHANRLDPNRFISIKYRIEGSVLTLEVKDESGRFFDPTDCNDICNQVRFVEAEDIYLKNDEIRERRAELNHDPMRPNGEGGMGVFLIQSYTDTVNYEPALAGQQVVGSHVTATWDMAKPKPE